MRWALTIWGNKSAYELLNKINQDFVDLIRETGRKTIRKGIFLIAGYWTDVVYEYKGGFNHAKNVPSFVGG